MNAGRTPLLSETLSRLYERTAKGIKFDLDVTRALLERFGNPHRSLNCVHVAGTNGKGSVCAMIESVFRAAGYRTGLYTSPHLVRFNERIKVGGCDITDAELAALFEEIEPHDRALAAAPGGREATFFEFTTVLALVHFQRKGVELVVLETGMGGRLDATNVVDPLVSVITRIGIEHREFLGDTIELIAAEKAGIIKPGRAVVCGAMDAAAREVIARTAAERSAPFIAAEDVVSVRRAGSRNPPPTSRTPPKEGIGGESPPLEGCPKGGVGAFVNRLKIETAETSYPPVALPLPGPYQLENVAAAVAAVEYVSQATPFNADEKTVKRGLESVSWPGRCQVLSEDPPVILDVAHNPDAARALASVLREIAGRRKVVLVFSLLSDKDCGAIMKELAPVVSRCIVVPLNTPRAMPVADIVACARRAGLEVSDATLAEARAQAVAWAREQGGVVCIAGSLYLAGDVLGGGVAG